MKQINALMGIITVALGTAATLNAQDALTDGLVGYYPFNGSANDASGNAKHGRIVGNTTPATDRFGRSANAYHFDGVSACIEITNTVFNVRQAEYTVSGWFCSDDVS